MARGRTEWPLLGPWRTCWEQRSMSATEEKADALLSRAQGAFEP
jgi:hypothetical protein